MNCPVNVQVPCLQSEYKLNVQIENIYLMCYKNFQRKIGDFLSPYVFPGIREEKGEIQQLLADHTACPN